MKFNRFSAFTLGVLVTAVSVSAVSYVNASSNSTIKACANKKTGAMRYIAKGACKKTERPLSWNQMGQQGLSGAPGAKGEPGAIGTAGTNGKNFHLIDSTGRDLGPALGVYSEGTHADILFEGGIWTLDTFDSYPRGNLQLTFAYSDSACEIPYFRPSTQPTARGWGGSKKYFKASGNPFMLSTRTFYAFITRPGGGGDLMDCTISSDPAVISQYSEWDWSTYKVTDVIEVSAPTYNAPFTIVAK